MKSYTKLQLPEHVAVWFQSGGLGWRIFEVVEVGFEVTKHEGSVREDGNDIPQTDPLRRGGRRVRMMKVLDLSLKGLEDDVGGINLESNCRQLL